jgi:hypothetical protein
MNVDYIICSKCNIAYDITLITSSKCNRLQLIFFIHLRYVEVVVVVVDEVFNIETHSRHFILISI